MPQGGGLILKGFVMTRVSHEDAQDDFFAGCIVVAAICLATGFEPGRFCVNWLFHRFGVPPIP